MALPMWLTGILSGGMSIIKEYVSSWAERKKMKAQHKVRMEALKQEGKEARAMLDKEQEVVWDKAMSEGSMTSWKDEYWTIILSIPMIGCFIPKLAPHILNGFEVLQKTPDWYKAAVGLAIAAAFGYRKFADYSMKKNLKMNGNGAGPIGPKESPHKSFKLTRKSIVDAIKDEAKEIKEDIMGEDE